MTDRSSEALIPALRRFQDAVDAMIYRRREIIDGKRRYADSWYQELVKAVAGGSAPRSGGPPTLPIWPAALDKLREIDTRVHSWHLEATDSHETHLAGTVTCLEVFAAAPWRPQDTGQITAWAKQLDAWVKAIDTLIDPPIRVYLPEPCPICGADTAFTEDSGEPVSHKPLVVTGKRVDTGINFEAMCAACDMFWEETSLSLLGLMIGRPLPDGVVEQHADTACGS